MKKVVHLISTDVFSGAENVACQIIDIFKEDQNYEMLYASRINSNLEPLKMRNIKYYELKKFNLHYVRKMIKEVKPDIIHAHDIRASIIASLLKSKNIKIVSHVHANHMNMRKLNLKTTLYQLVSKKFSSIIWISNSAYENYYFKKKVKEKSKIIYNIISIENLLKKVQNSNIKENYDIIYLGRLVYQKNPLRIIEIVKKIKEKKSNIKVAIIGDGELNDICREKIAQYNLQNNIIMYGFINNPYEILYNSKIMIMTSRYEGTPMCALEAIALGKPIVSTPTDGIIDIVKDGETGYLSNDDNILSEKILELLTDEEKYKRFCDKTKENSFYMNDIEKYRKDINSIYEKNKCKR